MDLRINVNRSEILLKLYEFWERIVGFRSRVLESSASIPCPFLISSERIENFTLRPPVDLDSGLDLIHIYPQLDRRMSGVITDSIERWVKLP